MNNSKKPFYPGAKARKAMVAWFSPLVLLRTLQDLVLSRIVGSQVDTRELQAIPEQVPGVREEKIICRFSNPYELEAEAEDFYFDFIADTGDGWDSTYSVASLLSRDQLILEPSDFLDQETCLPRGRFLLMGGDEIYPSPGESAYKERLLNPYQHSWDWLWLNRDEASAVADADTMDQRPLGEFISLQQPPDIFAIPGNHDWFDSLIAFRKLFCNVYKPTQLGQWRCRQSRSYFAISLPHDWVILAFDFGLDQYQLDGLQYHYFHNIISRLHSGSRLIIMAAEPNWVFGGVQNKKLHQAYQDVEQLIADVFAEKQQPAPRIYLNLSGDTHNYQRYESLSTQQLHDCMDDCAGQYGFSVGVAKQALDAETQRHTRQQIVAGGGGAFLHPTHGTTRKSMRVIPDRNHRLGEHTEGENISEVEIKDLYELKCCCPDMATSRHLARKLAFGFLPRNWSLALCMAAVYLVLAWPMRSFLDSVIIEKQLNGFADSGLNFLTLVISALLIAGYTLWAKRRQGVGLTAAGIVHGLLQVVLLYGGYTLVYLGMAHLWESNELSYGWFLFPISRDIVYFVLIGILAPTLLGLALWVYLTFFKTDHNDLFGSGSIAAYKHLLRLKIDARGNLIIYPIALENITAYSMPAENEISPQHLRKLREQNGSDWNTANSCAPETDIGLAPEAIKYRLIEAPIIITPEYE